MTLCPAQPDRLWQQNHSGVFTSEDGAGGWKRVSRKDQGVHFGFPIAADEKVSPGDEVYILQALSGG